MGQLCSKGVASDKYEVKSENDVPSEADGASASGPSSKSKPPPSSSPGASRAKPKNPSSTSSQALPRFHPLQLELRRLAGVSPGLKTDLAIVNAVINGRDSALVCENNTDSLWHAVAARGSFELLTALFTYCKNSWPQLQPLAQELAEKEPQVHEDSYRWAKPFVKLMLGRHNSRGNTPLMLACMNGRPDTVKFMMALGVDIWPVDSGGRTALHYAALSGHAKCCYNLVHKLPASGEQSMAKYVNIAGAGGATALHFAAASKFFRPVEVLLVHGAEINAASTKGTCNSYVDKANGTALHVAALTGVLEVVNSILKFHMGAKMLWEQQDPEGTAPLDPRTVSNANDKIPVQLAERYQHLACVALLNPQHDLSTKYKTIELQNALKPRRPSVPIRSSGSDNFLAMMDTGRPPRAEKKAHPFDLDPGKERVELVKSISVELGAVGRPVPGAVVDAAAATVSPAAAATVSAAVRQEVVSAPEATSTSDDSPTPTGAARKKSPSSNGRCPLPVVDFSDRTSIGKTKQGSYELLVKTAKEKPTMGTAVEMALHEEKEAAQGGAESEGDSESDSDFSDSESGEESDTDKRTYHNSLPELPESTAISHQESPRAPAAVTGIGAGMPFIPPPARRKKKHRSSLRRKAMRLAAKRNALGEEQVQPGEGEAEVDGQTDTCELCTEGFAEVMVHGCGHRMCRECAVRVCEQMSNQPLGCPVCQAAADAKSGEQQEQEKQEQEQQDQEKQDGSGVSDQQTEDTAK